jgi:uncharacterized repeat protein (TIGR01451 family)
MMPRIGPKLVAALAIQALLLGVIATGAQATSPGPPPGCAQATVTVDNTTPVPITDFGTVFSTNTVSSQNLVTLDVDVKTFITHSNSTELDIFLTSPSGTQVTLTTDNPRSFGPPPIPPAGNNTFGGTTVGTIWDDDGGTGNPPGGGPVTDNTEQTSGTHTTLVPEEAMGAFIGENPNGGWVLRIDDDTDDAATPNDGILNRWIITITTLDVTPTTFTTTFTNAPSNTAVPNPGTATFAQVVSGIGGYILDVNARTFIQHPDSRELDVFLSSATGTQVTLTTDNPETDPPTVPPPNNFNGTFWDDDANLLVTDNTPAGAPNSLVPEEAMGAFIGENPNGQWVLQVTDDTASGPAIQGVTQWELLITTAQCGQPDLALTKTDSPDPVNFGEPLLYTLSVSTGAATATNVRVTDTLPTQVTFQSVTTNQGTCNHSGGTVTCDLGTLGAGAGAVIQISVTAENAGQISNTATVTATSGDTNAANNTDTENTTVRAAGPCDFNGTDGPDVIAGTNGPDSICTLGGNDSVRALNGADTVKLGAGRDSGRLGGGKDVGRGGDDDDFVSGGPGADALRLGPGNDEGRGGGGQDSISCGSGNDFADGGAGNDSILRNCEGVSP